VAVIGDAIVIVIKNVIVAAHVNLTANVGVAAESVCKRWHFADMGLGSAKQIRNASAQVRTVYGLSATPTFAVTFTCAATFRFLITTTITIADHDLYALFFSTTASPSRATMNA
jgi:hypothetical protein